MASVNLLELVNRVRLFRRQPTTTVIATAEDQVTANAINMAMEDVLSTKRWEFDLRHNGQLTLRARRSSIGFETASPITENILISDSSSLLFDEDVFGDYVVSAYIGSSTEYPNTALRLASCSAPVGQVISFGAIGFTPNDAFSVTDGEFHYGEYILPDTVREVVRVSHQENQLELRQADPVVRYDELFPNPHETVSAPEVVAVGGFDTPTYETGTATPAPKLRMAVWPIPDDDYVLNYSYYYRHPELSSATDTLVGVPPSVVNDIVLQATSTVMMTWDQNFAASHFTDLSRQQAAAKHSAYGGSNARRRTIGSFERGRNSTRVELGFPNKLIGQ